MDEISFLFLESTFRYCKGPFLLDIFIRHICQTHLLDICVRIISRFTELSSLFSELERRNQELCIRCGNLEKENVFLKRDADELQTEVCELQLLVEDLQSRV